MITKFAPVRSQSEAKPDFNLAGLKVCLHVLGDARWEVRVMRAARSLAQVGATVAVIDAQGPIAPAVEHDLGGFRLEHIRLPQTLIETRFKRWFLPRAAYMFAKSAARLLRTQADIYHAMDLPALPACYLAAKLRRKPLIFEAFEAPLATLAAADMSATRRLFQRAVQPVLRHMARHSTHVIMVSPPIVSEAERQWGIANVALVRNIPEYHAPLTSDRLRQRLDLPATARIALYQGNLQSDRSLAQVVRAAKYLAPGNHIVLLGKSIPETQAELAALIASEGVADRVTMLPAVPYAELAQWTASADLGLIIYDPTYAPNVRMMLPNKFFQYLMAGLPVLTTRLDAITEIVTRFDVGRTLDSLEPATIAAAINDLLADPATLQHMRANALAACRAELSWEHEQKSLLRIYAQIWHPFRVSPPAI